MCGHAAGAKALQPKVVDEARRLQSFGSLQHALWPMLALRIPENHVKVVALCCAQIQGRIRVLKVAEPYAAKGRIQGCKTLGSNLGQQESP